MGKGDDPGCGINLILNPITVLILLNPHPDSALDRFGDGTFIGLLSRSVILDDRECRFYTIANGNALIPENHLSARFARFVIRPVFPPKGIHLTHTGLKKPDKLLQIINGPHPQPGVIDAA